MTFEGNTVKTALHLGKLLDEALLKGTVTL